MSTLKITLFASLLIVHVVVSAQGSTSVEQLGRESLEAARRIVAVQREFERQHAVDGASAGAYVRRLQQQGFQCRLQFRERVEILSAHNPDSRPKLEPGAECVRQPSGFAECAFFRVSMNVAWAIKSSDLRQLAGLMNSAMIRDTYFVCETEPRSADVEAAISDGLKRGYVVAL
jgi:hypothetical protein